MRDDLELARRAPAACDDPEIAPRIAPGDRRPGDAELDPPVGDQRAQALPAQTEDREEVVDAVRARRAVAEQQLHLVRARDAETIELIHVGGELHECGHPGPTRELRVLHDPPTRSLGRRVGLADEEVGEPHELIGGESGLVHHLDGRVGQSLVGEAHGFGEGLGVGRSGRRDLAHRRAEAGAVIVEHPQLVRRAQAGRAFEGGVLGVVDGRDATDLRVDGAQPRELALRRRLEVAGAPDDPRLLLDVPHGPQR